MVQQESETENHDVPQSILDATCGGRSMWTDGNKERDDTLYIDTRKREPGFHGQKGRKYEVNPDARQDFRDLPYSDESFTLIVFDPPYVVRPDGMSQLSGHVLKKYGALNAETWQEDIRAGFKELFRVLTPGGTLIFKFADNDVDFQDVTSLAPDPPLFGTTTKKNNSQTRFFVFHKKQ